MWDIIGPAISLLTSNSISNLHLTFKPAVIEHEGSLGRGTKGVEFNLSPIELSAFILIIARSEEL